jgi:small neutral amino acid transporter SnatA (MarC family)
VDRTMPPQSTKGMGGKETSERAQAASRATLVQSAHPSLASPQLPQMDVSATVKQQSVAYAYAFWFSVAVALSVYVFALSN